MMLDYFSSLNINERDRDMTEQSKETRSHLDVIILFSVLMKRAYQ